MLFVAVCQPYLSQTYPKRVAFLIPAQIREFGRALSKSNAGVVVRGAAPEGDAIREANSGELRGSLCVSLTARNQ